MAICAGRCTVHRTTEDRPSPGSRTQDSSTHLFSDFSRALRTGQPISGMSVPWRSPFGSCASGRCRPVRASLTHPTCNERESWTENASHDPRAGLPVPRGSDRRGPRARLRDRTAIDPSPRPPRGPCSRYSRNSCSATTPGPWPRSSDWSRCGTSRNKGDGAPPGSMTLARRSAARTSSGPRPQFRRGGGSSEMVIQLFRSA